jgi:diacylglycerol kinase (ATP)
MNWNGKTEDMKRRGIFRAFGALRHSYDGFVAVMRNESSFRQEAVLASMLIPIAVCMPVGILERILLVNSVLLVLLVELINSGIEATVDRVSYERHELAKIAKDCGSAAVTVSLVIWAITWSCILWPLVCRCPAAAVCSWKVWR